MHQITFSDLAQSGLVHSNSPKIISIRFDSIHARKSIRIDSNRFSSTVAAVDGGAEFASNGIWQD